MAKKHKVLGTQWYFPKKKRPFHTGTRYAAECLSVMGKLFIEEQSKPPTIQELRDFLVYEGEETLILDKLIKAGYGQELYFRWYE